MLVKHVSLDNPEAVKTFVANQKSWSNAYKENIANAYTHYVKQCGLAWEKPIYKRSRRLRALFSCLIVPVSYRTQILVERFK